MKMKQEEIEQMIFEYLDNELSKEKEEQLFKELYQNDFARQFFRNAALIRTATEAGKSEFPAELDEKIIAKISSGEKTKSETKGLSPVHKLIIYGMTAAMILWGLFTYSLLSKSHTEISKLEQIARYQNKTIQMIMNSMPDVQIRGKLNNEIIIQSKL
jgi:hypothetical protein